MEIRYPHFPIKSIGKIKKPVIVFNDNRKAVKKRDRTMPASFLRIS